MLFVFDVFLTCSRQKLPLLTVNFYCALAMCTVFQDLPRNAVRRDNKDMLLLYTTLFATVATLVQPTKILIIFSN